jgi:4-hydroxy-2-oxoheptanedioate aldolase
VKKQEVFVAASARQQWWFGLAGTLVIAALAAPISTPFAQTGRVYLNPVVEALAEGKHVFGVSTTDLSLQNAVSLAGNANLDYVYLDMEHNPLRFEEMKAFLAYITAGDKAGIIKRGTGQVRPAVFARFPPAGREDAQWIVKHALDVGLNGILINNIETKEQAENIVRTMRPNPRRGSPLATPRGLRGTVSCGFWASPANCRENADLWPLNPEGDLIFWPMIETMEGVRNADAIAQVPGVSGFYLGAAGDLSSDLGVESSHPEVNAAMSKILGVCQARRIPCGGTVSADNVASMMKIGYRIINFGGANGGMTAGNEAARQGAMKAGAKR